MSPLLTVVVIVLVIVVFFLLIFRWIGSLYRKVGPNQALIVSGGTATPQVVNGGGRLVIPMLQRAETFSLELMSFDVAPQQNLYTNQGVAVNVEAVTQLKVRNDKASILTAAEQFLSKPDQQREGMIRLVMEGHLRGIVGLLTVEQIVKEPEMVSEKMRTTSSADLAKMGLEVVSFTIKEVRDQNDYISNMGRPEIERVKKEANIAAALAQRDTQIQQANATREAAVARAASDQARVEAEAASQAKQAEFQRDLALKKASYDTEVKKQQMVAEKASDLQAAIQQQQIVAETARAQEIDKTAQVKVQEAEGQRRQMELEATVIKQANAEKQRVETMADAEKQRASLEAEGRATALRAQAGAEAEAARVRGAAEADATRLKGLAQADVIRAQGEAEAEAMRVKAAAYHEYNQAAVLDKLITNLPEVVRALAEPLSKVDKISIVSTGNGANGGSLGASRITGDMVNILAQVPALIEALTGAKVGNLIERIPGLSDGTTVEGTAVKSNGNGNGASNGASNTNAGTPAATASDASDAPATPPSATPGATPGAAQVDAPLPATDGLATPAGPARK
ncbi:MAG TPA: SPFH domain-containing protein [Ktedonobacterales bacterium]|jgi:flotillin|nr:SPFH domain-containing protein [Ktedonobacterales bacterium]